ncbi:TPR-like protein [Ramicandelaber brevisporus]|nr:TPR-like protein [Ramicandelaber brevisporus]
MNTSASRLLATAEEYTRDAEKAVKGGWFTKPDFEVAASNYERAAASFRNAGATQRAVDAYQKSSECYIRARSWFLAGRAQENIAAALLQPQQQHGYGANSNAVIDANAIIDAYTRASQYFMQHGQAPDKAAEMLDKAAKICQQCNDADRAIELFGQACQIYIDEDRGRIGMDVFRRAIGHAAQHWKLPEAVKFAEDYLDICSKYSMKSELAKAALMTVVLHLANGSVDGAVNVLDGRKGKSPVDPRDEVVQIAIDLVTAFEQHDGEALARVKKSEHLHYIEPNVARIAQNLELGNAPASAFSATPSAPAGVVSAAVFDEEGYLNSDDLT